MPTDINYVELLDRTTRAERIRIAQEAADRYRNLSAVDISVPSNTPCHRCGDRYNDHTSGMRGPCNCGGCANFVLPPTFFRTRFRQLLKWTKVWLKNHRAHRLDRLRRIKAALGNELGYFTYCNNGCGNAIVANNDVARRAGVRKIDGLSCGSCRLCPKCCSCATCVTCHQRRRAGHMCNICGQCAASGHCCICRQCANCGVQCGGDFCNGCGTCNKCCTCSDERRVPYITQKPKFHKCNLVQQKFNPTSRFIAAEIEVAGIRGYGKPIYELVRKWGGSIVHDGSLPMGGFEINTAPAAGDLFNVQIKEICSVLEKQKGFINGQCGLHVHLDARDLNYYDIRRLVNVYASIEPALFAMVPTERQASKYCLPCGDKYKGAIATGRLPYEQVKEDVIFGVYSNPSTELRRTNKYEKARYNALNLHSWFYRGTIESRMYAGTIESSQITNWGIMWALILSYVASTTDDDVAQDMVGSPYTCLRKVVEGNTNTLDFIRGRVLEWGSDAMKKETA